MSGTCTKNLGPRSPKLAFCGTCVDRFLLTEERVQNNSGVANEGWSFANPGYPPGKAHILREPPSTTVRNVYKTILARNPSK